jgi:2'-5' RNA ligase
VVKYYIFTEILCPKELSRKIRLIDNKFGKKYIKPLSLHMTLIAYRKAKIEDVKRIIRDTIKSKIKIEIIGIIYEKNKEKKLGTIVYLKLKKNKTLSKFNKELYSKLSKYDKEIKYRWDLNFQLKLHRI